MVEIDLVEIDLVDRFGGDLVEIDLVGAPSRLM